MVRLVSLTGLLGRPPNAQKLFEDQIRQPIHPSERLSLLLTKVRCRNMQMSGYLGRVLRATSWPGILPEGRLGCGFRRHSSVSCYP